MIGMAQVDGLAVVCCLPAHKYAPPAIPLPRFRPSSRVLLRGIHYNSCTSLGTTRVIVLQWFSGVVVITPVLQRTQAVVGSIPA